MLPNVLREEADDSLPPAGRDTASPQRQAAGEVLHQDGTQWSGGGGAAVQLVPGVGRGQVGLTLLGRQHQEGLCAA